MTGESAQRAALGGGAIVMDVLARTTAACPRAHRRIRRLRPDMILLSGASTAAHQARRRHGGPDRRGGPKHASAQLPAAGIYAGNIDARDK